MPENLDMLWASWKQQPTEDNLTRLTQAMQPVVQGAIRSYAADSQQDPVIELTAKKLALDALQSYNPDKGAALNTYLYHQLKPLIRARYQRTFVLHTPQRVWADLQNMRRGESELSDQLGREPSAGELADNTGLSLKRLTYLQQFRHTGIPESALLAQGQEYKAPAGEPTEPFWVTAVYQSLNPKDQLLFDWRTGAHGSKKLSGKEIAKNLGVSEAAVSQKSARIADLIAQGVADETVG